MKQPCRNLRPAAFHYQASTADMRAIRKIKAPKSLYPAREADPAIPPAAFISKTIPELLYGHRLLYIGADIQQFSYAETLKSAAIITDVLDCSRKRCERVQSAFRWINDVIHGWVQLLPKYGLPYYTTIMWVNGPCTLTKEQGREVIKSCIALQPARLVIVNELAPPDPLPTVHADMRYSQWKAEDFQELGLKTHVWPMERGSVIAWRDCR